MGRCRGLAAASRDAHEIDAGGGRAKPALAGELLGIPQLAFMRIDSRSLGRLSPHFAV